ncbi:hypothetical protein SAY86_031111 [Trapa natans]|uniref:Uncharacterized protein n=1 Tax=Trapa natans TaxID=22666 RepID=A0AAN7RE48_TRANT|nr:hypothetical protein SAY86_031111 [Trapa natans]
MVWCPCCLPRASSSTRTYGQWKLQYIEQCDPDVENSEPGILTFLQAVELRWKWNTPVFSETQNWICPLTIPSVNSVFFDSEPRSILLALHVSISIAVTISSSSSPNLK